MRVAFIIYDRMTAMDFIGVYDAVIRLRTMKFMPELEWEICARTTEVIDGNGLRFIPTTVKGSLEGYDMVIVPGGYGSRELARDSEFISWLETASPRSIKASVCSGSVLLGAAGFLKGKSATTHRSAFDELRPFCESVVDRRIVDEGDVITARGVTSSIDLGLYLCEKLAGREARATIAKQMDYLGYALEN